MTCACRRPEQALAIATSLHEKCWGGRETALDQRLTTLHAIGEMHLVSRESEGVLALGKAEEAYRESLSIRASPEGHTGLAQTLMHLKHHTEGLKEMDKAANLMKKYKRTLWPPPGRPFREGVVPKPSEESWGGASGLGGLAPPEEKGPLVRKDIVFNQPLPTDDIMELAKRKAAARKEATDQANALRRT